MRIAIVSRDYHPRKGIERVAGFYARGLRDLGHQVTVVCNEHEAGTIDDGIKFEKLPCAQSPDAWRIFDFAAASGRYLRQNSFDQTVVLGAASLAPDTIIVANSVHRRWFHSSLQALRPTQLRWWLKRFNPLHYAVLAIEEQQYRKQPYRRIIAVSEPIKQELNEEYGLPGQCIDVLPNGADLHALRRNTSIRQAKRKELGLSDNEHVLLMAANEFERKGLRPLLHALTEVSNGHLRLVVVSGADCAPYRQLATELGVSDRVMFRPATPNIEQYYFAADLYVLPTRYEAWNLSITEAAAAGLPVITTNLGQADKVVDDGKSGYLLSNPNDVSAIANAIGTWIAEPDKEAMSAYSARRAEEYAWPKQIEKLERILEETLERGPKIQTLVNSQETAQ